MLTPFSRRELLQLAMVPLAAAVSGCTILRRIIPFFIPRPKQAPPPDNSGGIVAFYPVFDEYDRLTEMYRCGLCNHLTSVEYWCKYEKRCSYCRATPAAYTPQRHHFPDPDEIPERYFQQMHTSKGIVTREVDPKEDNKEPT